MTKNARRYYAEVYEPAVEFRKSGNTLSLGRVESTGHWDFDFFDSMVTRQYLGKGNNITKIKVKNSNAYNNAMSTIYNLLIG